MKGPIGKLYLLPLLLTLFFLLPTISKASNNQFITIVNPVRISSYNSDPKGSLVAEYSEIKKRNLPATWLFTYDALANKDLLAVAKALDQKQELGVFLEVSPNYASSSGVVYNKTDSWFRSNSLFLSGYTQQNRIKLIDSIFHKFKDDFGFYPESIGAWWVDSYSLSYMKQKYNITANLSVADQHSTDGYSVWGTYWSTPYFPSNLNAAIPANSLKNKLDLVTLQWAPRDPINGYGEGEASRFSTQDYRTIGLKDDYFTKLVSLYGESQQNSFGQITAGLEADLSPDSYSQAFANQLDILKTLPQYQITTMGEFSSWYRQAFPQLSPPQVVKTSDLLGKNMKVIWYQSPFYRIGIVYNGSSKTTTVIDWRVYPSNFEEAFYQDPNSQLNIYIDTPSVIDTVNNSNLTWQFNKELVSVRGDSKNYILTFNDNSKIVLTGQKIYFNGFYTIPSFLTKSSLLNSSHSLVGITVSPTDKLSYPPPGLVFRSLNPELLARLSRINLENKKYLIAGIVVSVGVVIGLFIFFRLNREFKIGAILIVLGTLLFVIFKESSSYFVSQDEITALLFLKSLPAGKVIVKNSLCLNCSYNSDFMPGAFINQRNYVYQISGKPIVYNLNIFTTISRVEGKAELASLGAKYIYLAKYGNYIETLPFSPRDYNVEKIYENGNAQIWEVK